MNKYGKAVECVKDAFDTEIIVNGEPKRLFNLLDDLDKMVQIGESITNIKELIDNYHKLEIALDKAIVSLTFADHLLGNGKSTYSYDQWKNWLLT